MLTEVFRQCSARRCLPPAPLCCNDAYLTGGWFDFAVSMHVVVVVGVGGGVTLATVSVPGAEAAGGVEGLTVRIQSQPTRQMGQRPQRLAIQVESLVVSVSSIFLSLSLAGEECIESAVSEGREEYATNYCRACRERGVPVESRIRDRCCDHKPARRQQQTLNSMFPSGHAVKAGEEGDPHDDRSEDVDHHRFSYVEAAGVAGSVPDCPNTSGERPSIAKLQSVRSALPNG